MRFTTPLLAAVLAVGFGASAPAAPPTAPPLGPGTTAHQEAAVIPGGIDRPEGFAGALERARRQRHGSSPWKRSYSLAEALNDALWRARVSDRLKRLFR